MKVDIRLENPGLATRSDLFARVARFLCEAAILSNRDYISSMTKRSRAVPKLYASGVRYQNEPAGQPDWCVDIPVILRRRWGDCLHLCAWRVAELREQGENAQVRMYWLFPAKNQRMFHVQVRRADGSIEDPSRKLGM